MNHPCDEQMDRRTDGIAIAYARLAYMLSRAKKNERQVVELNVEISTGVEYLDSHEKCGCIRSGMYRRSVSELNRQQWKITDIDSHRI